MVGQPKANWLQLEDIALVVFAVLGQAVSSAGYPQYGALLTTLGLILKGTLGHGKPVQ